MKNIKDYLSQIKLEIKKILGSKLLLVFMILLAVLSIGIPILSKLDLFKPNYYYGGYYDGELVVNDVTIDEENIFFWEIMNAQNTKEMLQGQASTDIDDLAIEIVDIMLEDYIAVSKEVTSYEDYRARVVWSRREHFINIFILEHLDISSEDMREALEKSDTYYMNTEDLEKNYYNLTDEEKAKKLSEAKEAIELSDEIVLTGDHQAYFDYMMNEAENEIVNIEKQIEELNQTIAQDGTKEEILSEQIKNLERNLKNQKEITLPMLEYRIEHDIIPGDGDWRDTALNHKESSLYQLNYNSEIMTQEEFEKDANMKWQYESYNDYKKDIEKKIQDATDRLHIADKSLESNEPDMDYVPNGTRKKVTNFLWYSLLIAVFATIFAGGLMAREFQSGTIRLLLIRPKGRAKIALSKYFALVIICVGLYAVCVILNLLTNGIMFGFADLGYPNYSISAGVQGVSFFAFIVPKLLGCFVVVIFGASIAYFLSIVTRNTALSVSIPLVAFAGSLITMGIIGYSEKFKWIIYTPLPYVNMPQILTESYYSPQGVEPIVSLGIAMLLGISLLAVVFGTIILRKRDITN